MSRVGASGTGVRRSRLFPEDPRRVGKDPDYRFTLANERTFLSWVRTSLALAAGGLGAVTILDDFTGEEALGIGLLALSFVTAATAYRRWALNERAMRLDEPLPASRLPMMMAVGVAVVAVTAAVLLVVNAG
ncbi:MAG: YidH family protein [Ilumatobacteraceae bacterium]